MERDRENVRFQPKTGRISEMVRNRPTLLHMTNRKLHKPFQMRRKSSTLDWSVITHYCG